MLYELIATYVKLRGPRLLDYVHIIVSKFQEYFSQEQAHKPKEGALKILGRVLKYIKHPQVME